MFSKPQPKFLFLFNSCQLPMNLQLRSSCCLVLEFCTTTSNNIFRYSSPLIASVEHCENCVYAWLAEEGLLPNACLGSDVMNLPFPFRPVSAIGNPRTKINSPKKASNNTAHKKDPVISLICPTTGGIMKDPRFPAEVINPTALATDALVSCSSTGIVRTRVNIPTVQSPVTKATNHTDEGGNVPTANMKGPLKSPKTSMKGFRKPALSDMMPIAKEAMRKPRGNIDVNSPAVIWETPSDSSNEGNHMRRVSYIAPAQRYNPVKSQSCFTFRSPTKAFSVTGLF